MNDEKDSITVSSSTVIDLNDYSSSGSTNHLGQFGNITIDTNTLNYSNTYITSGTSSAYSWPQNYNYSFTGVPETKVNINADGITMPEGSDIKVGGKSLTDAIEKIEERLGILKPNPELEDRWEQLKALRKQYMDLEKDLLEKEKMWEILKKS
jgi:hypothetical protein